MYSASLIGMKYTMIADSIDLHGTLLYEAATNSLASDASANNCWSKMVECSKEPKFVINLKDIERQIKEEYKLTTMPNAWRSAKSVVLGALAQGVSLIDENGNIIGKTEIQNKLISKKVGVSTLMVGGRSYISIVTELRLLYKKATSEEKRLILLCLIGNIPGLKEE